MKDIIIKNKKPIIIISGCVLLTVCAVLYNIYGLDYASYFAVIVSAAFGLLLIITDTIGRYEETKRQKVVFDFLSVGTMIGIINILRHLLFTKTDINVISELMGGYGFALATAIAFSFLNKKSEEN